MDDASPSFSRTEVSTLMSIPPTLNDVNQENVVFYFQSHRSFYMMPKLCPAPDLNCLLIWLPFLCSYNRPTLRCLFAIPPFTHTLHPAHFEQRVQNAIPEQQKKNYCIVRFNIVYYQSHKWQINNCYIIKAWKCSPLRERKKVRFLIEN